jgi:hypothetical protein
VQHRHRGRRLDPVVGVAACATSSASAETSRSSTTPIARILSLTDGEVIAWSRVAFARSRSSSASLPPRFAT